MNRFAKKMRTLLRSCTFLGAIGGESGLQTTRPVLLVVSFGTSYNDNRDLTIGAVERAIQKAYPQYEIRRAFTSQIILDILKERDHLEIDNVGQAMERLAADGVRDVVIQPTHVMSGIEYDGVIAQIGAYRSRFHSMKVGRPLLVEDRDYDTLIQALAEETAAYNADDTAIVFMGHGTEHAANATYPKLQQKLIQAGFHNFFIGTVEAEPTVEDVLADVRKTDVKKVVLLPLMVVAGDHANNDMAGDAEDTWKAVFANAGYETRCVLKGLGQYPAVQQMFVDHVADAMAGDHLPQTEENAEEPSGVILPTQIADGAYEITVDSSSSMFRVVKCVLKVEKGTMTAAMTMSGDGYGKVYMGTSEEASQAPEGEYIAVKTDEQGNAVFTVPVAALNQEIACAAWSVRRKNWYDRVLVFRGDTAICRESRD